MTNCPHFASNAATEMSLSVCGHLVSQGDGATVELPALVTTLCSASPV